MNFTIFSQQLHQLTAPLGALGDPWRLVGPVPCLLLGTTLSILLPYLWVQIKKERLYRQLPSPGTSPLLGRLLGHLELYWNAPAELKKLSPTVWFYYFVAQLVRPIQEAGESLLLIRLGPFYKWVMVIKGETAKALLSSSKYHHKSLEYEFLKEFVGESLVTGNVAGWKVRRKLLEPSFHLEILHKFLPAMNAHSRVFCRVIASKMDTQTGRALLPDIRPLTASSTQDILCETVMGVQMNSQTEGAISQVAGGARQAFPKLIFTIGDLICERSMTPWLYPKTLFRLSSLGRKTAQVIATGRQFTNTLLVERKRTLTREIADCTTVEQASARLTGGKRLSFLDLLLVNHLKGGEAALDWPYIENEVYEFMIAGTDTTATTMQMALLLLGLHPEKQALLHQELDALFGDDAERDISIEDLRQMTYLDMCIKEIMRLYPGISIIGRTLPEDLQMGAHLVPQGTTVIVNIPAINRDPEVWSQADEFIPERFSPNSMEQRHSHSYLPFSTGARSCIGSRFALFVLKVFLATLLRHYSIRSLTAQEDTQLGFFIFAKPNAPISIEFTPRKANVPY